MLWKGRFKKELNEQANEFNASITIDKALSKHDIVASVAHAEMLCRTGIITEADNKEIAEGLNQILSELEAGTLSVDESCEDIHTFVEGLLTSRIGDAGKRLHTARSRNDQVATDFRLYLRDEATDTVELLKDFCEALCEIASEHTSSIMPGYTHLQRGQPVTFGHHLMAYVYMFIRDIDRIKDACKRMNVMPLGSGALAGTTFSINRNITAEILGFDKPCENSMDGVSDRDFVLELSFCLSVVMTHISRLCEEIIMWNSWEFKFIELDDSYTTGSSIMPQKKNPDIAELARGKTGRVYGSLVSLLTVFKSLPLAYNKDMQEDKEPLLDSFKTVNDCLLLIAPMMATMTVNKENMRTAAAKGFINATDCADYLTKKGMPFRTAYKITGELVAYAIDNNKTLEQLTQEEFNKFSDLFADDIYIDISLENCVAKRTSEGGPCEESLLKQIRLAKEAIGRA
ncbi:MAG: argininosuccinate lyase [Eubacteriales bacterium]|nr:argininosuccinate lyase [Eubacteriales bacterium]